MADPALQTVQLHDADSSLEATFVPGAGMLCCSLRHRGEELLAQNAGVEAYAGRGKTMGIPLLYPWANRLAAFDYTIEGRTVAVPHDTARVALEQNGLPIHGVIGGRLQWKLGDEDADSPPCAGSSLTARLSWSAAAPDLFEVFPFRHDLTYTATLAQGRLEIQVGVHACGTDMVPVAFGFHPYLQLPGTSREHWQVQLPALRHLALDTHQIPTGPDGVQPAREFALGEEVFDDGFDQVAQPARFTLRADSRRIALTLTEGYPCAQVYSPQGGQFICFEPMTARANALRSGSGLHLLAPGERYRATFSVTIEDLPTTA
jgi:aldose 1-epimerase